MRIPLDPRRTYRFLSRLFATRFGKAGRELVEPYLREHVVRKLHLGWGSHTLTGWLNADLHRCSADVLYLDASRRFPLAEDQFDCVFSEHMIEHLSYPQGETMLAECFRVLRANGRIRVSTPDLSFLIDLYAMTSRQSNRNT